ncbi:phospholipase D endonuclease [Chlamydia felis Fe/C-56]|uniref:Phospholipase D endonuclease n=1 Tax=Chlamydia felis (strain Fe/C-56) TaxID=264202 RepID=Q254S3_CHLFF|nr:MAC/perforin domain-containing protein [Chlamydia felis]BAE81215.1 phospholipase D endonuclease [Chlamydia felis Fe/C-56]
MPNSQYLYLVQPYTVFNPRLGRCPLPLDSYMEEENRLASFIEKIPSDVFETQKFVENNESPYILSLSSVKNGTLFQIVEPRLSACAATCIVDLAIDLRDKNPEILEEIKQALLRSALDGVQYLITQESPPEGSFEPELSLVGDEIELVRNVSFLGRAVDIVKLDPLNILNSISSENILDYSFSQSTAQLSSDGRFGIPPGTKLLPKPSLDVEIDTSIFEETTSFTKNFSTSVTINVPPPALSQVDSLSLGSPAPLQSGQTEILVTRKQLFPSYEPKLLDIVKKYKREAKILINKITFANIWRNQAKSQILTEGKVRLDLQGFDGAKYNYQLQVGSHTISAVLINREIANIKSPSEQTYAIRKIKSGFQKSLDDCHIYLIELKKGVSLLSGAPEVPLVGGDGDEESDGDLAQGAAFSLSVTYEFVQKSTHQAKNTVTCSTAAHSLYILKEDEGNSQKKLDSGFQSWVETKLKVNDPSSFEAFIQRFGTHYITSATYGGMGFQALKLSFQQVEELQSQKISLETAAANSLIKGSVSNQVESGYSSYDSKSSSHTVFLGGTVLPSMKDEHLDFTEWSESVRLEPVPIQVSLLPIADLLTTDFFPKENQDTLAQKKKSLKQAVRVYLKKHKTSERKERAVFTSGANVNTAWFTLEAAHSPLVVSNPYMAVWSTLPYLFPTLKESSAASPIVFYFCIDNNGSVTQNILHNTYCFLGSVAIQRGFLGQEFTDYPFLSFYGIAGEAYFDSGDYSDRCGWIVEKLNTTKDQFLRDGDEVRLKHSASKEYLATTPLKDNHRTLSRTSDMNDAVFIIRIANFY